MKKQNPIFLFCTVFGFFLFFSQPSLAGLHFDLEWWPLSHKTDWSDESDPRNPISIIVDDPSAPILAELPSGNIDLKTYRASNSVIGKYAKHFNIEGGTTKDFAKAPLCSRSEIDALRRWTSQSSEYPFDYVKINGALRLLEKGNVDGKPLDPVIELQILVTASAVNCAPQYEGPVVRGENTPPAILAQYSEGNNIGLRAFTSTTKGQAIAISIYEPHQKITINNAWGADVDSLGISEWPSEKEVLIRPGTVFKVLTRKDEPKAFIQNEFVFHQWKAF